MINWLAEKAHDGAARQVGEQGDHRAEQGEPGHGRPGHRHDGGHRTEPRRSRPSRILTVV